MTQRIPVAVLGATGTVGQKFVRLLAEHPWFEVAAVAASSASAGRTYDEVTRWREPVPMPPRHRPAHRARNAFRRSPGRDRLLRAGGRGGRPHRAGVCRVGRDRGDKHPDPPHGSGRSASDP